MTYHRICNYINTSGAISGAGIASTSAVTPGFSGVRVTRIFYV